MVGEMVRLSYIRAMCRASSTILGPFIRGMRQRLSAVPATARSMSSSVSAPANLGLRPLTVHGVGSHELIEHPAVGSV